MGLLEEAQDGVSKNMLSCRTRSPKDLKTCPLRPSGNPNGPKFEYRWLQGRDLKARVGLGVVMPICNTDTQESMILSLRPAWG